MSKFVYSYQKILEMKEKDRENIELSYAKLISVLDIEEAKLRDLHKKQSDIKNEVFNAQEKGVFILNITMSQEYLQYLDLEVINQSKIIKDVEKQIELKYHELVNIKIEEKKWLNLKEKKYSEYLFELNRDEQKEIDEIASNRVLR